MHTYVCLDSGTQHEYVARKEIATGPLASTFGHMHLLSTWHARVERSFHQALDKHAGVNAKTLMVMQKR